MTTDIEQLCFSAGSACCCLTSSCRVSVCPSRGGTGERRNTCVDEIFQTKEVTSVNRADENREWEKRMRTSKKETKYASVTTMWRQVTQKWLKVWFSEHYQSFLKSEKAERKWGSQKFLRSRGNICPETDSSAPFIYIRAAIGSNLLQIRVQLLLTSTILTIL